MPEQHPHLIRAGGLALWRFADGRVLPLLAGGDDGDGGDGGDGKDGKDGAGKAGGSGSAGGSGDGGGSGSGDGDGDPAEKARREAADLRRRLRAAEKERDDLKASQQTDAERLSARAEAAEARATGLADRVRKANLRLAVLTEAPDLGIVDSRLAMRLLDAEKLSYDEETDEPEREPLVAALKAAAKEYPSLTRGGDADGGRRTGGGAEQQGGGKASVNDYLRGDEEALRR